MLVSHIIYSVCPAPRCVHNIESGFIVIILVVNAPLFEAIYKQIANKSYKYLQRNGE